MAPLQPSRPPHLKGPVSPPPLSHARPWWSKTGKHLRDWKYIYVLVVIALYSNHYFRAQFLGNAHGHALDDGSYSESSELWTEWLDITPSEKLRWQPCFGIYGTNLQCARLTVPMDYSRPLNESADHPKVHLALIMATGAGRTQDPSTYAETPLLINPGGPGGSGVMLLQARAKSLQLFLDGQHDIIGFDPRGVGASTPKADCFASPNSADGVLGRNVAYMNRLTWVMSGQEVGSTNSSDVALIKLSARARAMAKLCGRVDQSEGDGSIFRYMNTPHSARDMLSIVHAWDEWRLGSQIAKVTEQEDTKSTSSENHQMPDIDDDSNTSLRGKLVYWGFSYGTLLGATFASMFPDKVGRIALDGVVHADRYVNPTWESSIADADAIWDKFFVYCAEAGPACSFYRTGDGPEGIRRRFGEVMARLEEEPVAVLLPDTNLPALVTASDMKKSVFFGGTYTPNIGFPVVADLLAHALDGRLGEIAKGEGMVTLCGNLTLPVWPDDAMRAIACSDKRYKFSGNLTELQSQFEHAATYSWFADVWFGIEPNLGCNGWDIKSKGPSMPWDDHPARKPALIETSFPILFLSNSLDPVTPLGHALDMTRKFANASIVEQDALGHCSLSCVSTCAIAHVRAYLNDGVVPAPPKFKTDSSNEGEWPRCKCLDKPWASPSYAAGEPMSEHSVNKVQAQAYEDLRAHLFAFTLSHQLEYNNPLKEYLVDRSRAAAGYP